MRRTGRTLGLLIRNEMPGLGRILGSIFATRSYPIELRTIRTDSFLMIRVFEARSERFALGFASGEQTNEGD